MKRFILLSAVLCVNLAYASERPIWEDNCPQGLHNAVYKDIQWYWPESTKSTQEIYNYWAKRRDEFQNGLAQCDFMSETFRDVCYENLRSKQAIDNDLYNLKIEQRKISSQVWRDTNKMTSPVMFNILPK